MWSNAYHKCTRALFVGLWPLRVFFVSAFAGCCETTVRRMSSHLRGVALEAGFILETLCFESMGFLSVVVNTSVTCVLCPATLFMHL